MGAPLLGLPKSILPNLNKEYTIQLAGWPGSEQGLAGTKEQLLFSQLTVKLTT